MTSSNNHSGQTPLSRNDYALGSSNGRDYFGGNIDDARIYQTALNSNAIAKVYSNALQNVCTAASHTGSSIIYQDIKMSEVDEGESRIENSNTIEVSVDATAPNVAFTSIGNGELLRIEEGKYRTISGSVTDPDSQSSNEEASGIASDRLLDLPFDTGRPYASVPWEAESLCQSDASCPSATTDGKNGNGMTFDGSSDYLLVDDEDMLDLNADYTVDGAWHHWACTFDVDSSIRTIYMDGEVLASKSTYGNIYQGSGDLTVGAANMTGSYPWAYFDGTLDEVLIFQRALSAGEIGKIASYEQVGDAPSLAVNFDLEANHGACSGDECPSVISNGVVGEALHFEWGDRVSIPDNDSLDLDHEFTIAFWVRPTKQMSNWEGLVGKPINEWTVRNYSFFIVNNDSATMMPSYRFRSGDCQSSIAVDGGGSLTEDKWHHLATTYDGSTVTFYVDGAAAATRNHTGGICQNDDPLQIGGASDNTFVGDLDELLIYRRPLSADEVSALAQTTKPTDIPILDATFNVNDPYLLPTRDLSGQSNTAYCEGGECPQPTQSMQPMADGRVGDAMRFDGVDDHLVVPGGLDLANKSFSVVFWAKRNSSGTNDFVFSQGRTATNEGLHIGFRDSDLFTCAFWYNGMNSDDTYTDNDWHQWVCTYDHHGGVRLLWSLCDRLHHRRCVKHYADDGLCGCG